MIYAIALTLDQINTINYALTELACRRAEQAIDFGSSSRIILQKESSDIMALAKRFREECQQQYVHSVQVTKQYLPNFFPKDSGEHDDK